MSNFIPTANKCPSYTETNQDECFVCLASPLTPPGGQQFQSQLLVFCCGHWVCAACAPYYITPPPAGEACWCGANLVRTNPGPPTLRFLPFKAVRFNFRYSFSRWPPL